MTKEKIEEKKVGILPLNLQTIKFKLKGSTPLLVDKFPESARKQIEEKQRGKKSLKTVRQESNAEVEQAIHYLPDGSVGFPA